MSSCEKPAAEEFQEPSSNLTTTTSTTDEGGGSSSPGGSEGPSWSAEFKKRRYAFESAVENEDGGIFDFAERSRKFREMISLNPCLVEPGLDYNRIRSDSSSSIDCPVKSPSHVRPPPPPSWPSVPHPPSEPPQEPGANSRVSINGQRFIDADDDDGLGPLGLIPAHRTSSNNQRVLAIGEETGQKERVVPYTTSNEVTSPLQSDDSERDDTGLSKQIQFLTVKNQQLQNQLEERELERDRLREQLDTQRVDKGHRSIYSPPGLPSRVLDGRKVLRDSVPVVTSPGILSPGIPCSPVPPPSSPFLLHSPRRVASPLPHAQRSATPTITYPHLSSPGLRPRPQGLPTTTNNNNKDYESSPIAKRGNNNPTEFIMPPGKPDGASSGQYAQQQIDTLKRSNFELEKRLHDLSEERRKLEADLGQQGENFVKMQAREQDLLKDIETLRDENSHHTGALKRLQTEREGLKSDNESLQDDVSTIADKLNKTEKYYKEVEHENLTLEADIKQLITDKRTMFVEKQKLQITVDNDFKTKENFRSTIKQLREQNQSLEMSMMQPPGRETKAAKPAKKKVVLPTTREQKTLGEVMNLREEKLQLQDRLMVAQHEIDSLEAHLKVQDSEEIEVTGDRGDEEEGELFAHLSQFHSRVEAIRADLDTVQSAVSFFSSQQQILVRESFKMLAAKCREHISAADKDRSRLSEKLGLAERSLGKMEEDYEILKSENAKLQLHKSRVSSEVSALKEEISKLHDQKRMQDAQISQGEALARERDAKLGKIEQEQRQLQEKYSISEQNWKKEVKRLELDWVGKVAEAAQKHELLCEERDQLSAEKSRLETRLAEVAVDNERLARARDDAELLSKRLEARMVAVMLEADANERTICKTQEDMANLLVQKAFLSARLRLEGRDSEAKLASLQERSDSVTSALRSEKSDLQSSLSSLEQEKHTLEHRLREIADKERHIRALEAEISTLARGQTHLQREMDALAAKHSKVVQDFRMLEDADHGRRLDNEKVKMTLTTEIKLLKSKLSSVEKERGKLNETLTKATAESAAIPSSAFHAISTGKQVVDQLKKQVALLQSELKQQRKLNVESRSSQMDFQHHISMLESENIRLKESALKVTTSGSAYSTLDEEAASVLRKKVTEMTRKMFFLESDKKNLNDKVRSLTSSLKASREAKEHVTNDHVQKLQGEITTLRERVHSLEGELTRKLMAADSRIVETVKENDKLRQIVLKIQSTLLGPSEDQLQQQQTPGGGLESLLSLLKSHSEVLQDLKVSLTASSGDLEKLELGHHRIEGLQQELQLQLSLVAEEQSTDAAAQTGSPVSGSSSNSGRSVPAVFKSLPAGYISNLQGWQRREGAAEGGSSSLRGGAVTPRSLSLSTVVGNNAELQRKMVEMETATSDFGLDFQRHKMSLLSRDVEVDSMQERLAAMETFFKGEADRTSTLKSVLSGIHGLELKSAQLQTVMQRQIEQLQDQVIDRDSALGDIETQMKADFEMHQRKFAQMKSQVIELREALSSRNDVLRSKDQYIQKTEERCLSLEAEAFQMRKEMERRLDEQKQLMRQGLPEGTQLEGMASVADVIRIQGDEMNQLKELLRDFTLELSQVQSQLDSVQREKSVLQSKAIEMERMHIQMKEHMGSDINYLRQLNLQLVEQQMKSEKATEILKEVKAAQSVFKKQKDMILMESELDASKTRILEQQHKITELEYQLASQTLSLRLLHAEKDHSIMLTHHTPDKIPGVHMRPRSAESARKPNYKFKSRIGVTGLNMNSGEFSIVVPSQNSTHGNVDILNLEEQPEPPDSAQRATLTLGPMVVTDDECPVQQEVTKATVSSSSTGGSGGGGKHQRCQRLKRGHRRTVSTGSDIVVPEKEAVGPTNSNPIPVSQAHQGGGSGGSGGGGGSSSKQKSLPKHPKRPGSAGSSRQDVHIRQESVVQPPTEQITKTAHALSEYMNTLIDDHGTDTSTAKLSLKKATEALGQAGSKDKRGVASLSGGVGLAGKKHHYHPNTGNAAAERFEASRNKLANKSTDSNETTSSEGNGFSSKGSSQSDSSGGGLRQDSKRSVDFGGLARRVGGGLNSFQHKAELAEAMASNDLSRTESMSSTCSTLSIYGNSTLPSRNHSFTYDGGESSTNDLEIGDSVENLQALGHGKLGYNPYITPIMPSEAYTTSSSDEENYLKNRRKKSSTTGDNTPRHKDTSYHTNNSCDSDTLQRNGYRSNGREPKKLVDIPAHVNESISVSDMDRDTTDIEMEQKAADLQHRFGRGRVRYSSTGSVKICYSESSNTSMEDISKN